jgi:hypothetical protein
MKFKDLEGWNIDEWEDEGKEEYFYGLELTNEQIAGFILSLLYHGSWEELTLYFYVVDILEGIFTEQKIFEDFETGSELIEDIKDINLEYLESIVLTKKDGLTIAIYRKGYPGYEWFVSSWVSEETKAYYSHKEKEGKNYD